MIGSLRQLLTRRGPEAEIPLKWILQRPSRIGASYSKAAKVEIKPDRDGLNIVTVNGTPFVWPADASIDHLLLILSELYLPNHPHQYLWGHTQIAPGDTVLDIGSCEGSFAALAAEKGANVVAIEPSPMMQQIIRRLFEVRKLPAAQIAACALGTTGGTVTLVEERAFPGYARVDGEKSANSTSVDVPLKTLDAVVEEFQLSRVDFIKCDAEGLDVDILRSGVATLQRFKPKLAICTYHDDNHFNELATFLKPLGYNVEGKGFLRTLERFRPMMLHAW